MLLKKKHFVNFKINWIKKSLNISKIAEELDLGLDSFVFWDDNPLERNLVRKILPAVITIEPDKEIINWASQLSKTEAFSSFDINSEKVNQTKRYKARAKFINDKNTAKDEYGYLKSIKLKANLNKVSKIFINRASEMTIKTNQLNLRTQRYTVSDFTNIIYDKNYYSFIINLRDIYADHGLVGLIVLKKLNSKYVFLDTFLMSCRVIGRYFEVKMFDFIKKFCEKNNFEFIIGEYIPTKKNIMSKNILSEIGFVKLNKKINNIDYKNNKNSFIAEVSKIQQKFKDLYD